nr:tyrosine-type recombinase/integrase [Salinigranum marinum]
MYRTSTEYLHQRDDAIIATVYDIGLRIVELVALDIDYLRDDASKLYLPGHIQKDYPNENTPPPKTLGLASDTTRLLRSYLTNRWKDSSALFPSRSSDRLSTQGVRDLVHKVAEVAEVRPFKIDGNRGDASDVTPHALRHSTAWRMMNAEDGNTLYDVRSRLRHRSIQTTGRIYDHINDV